MAKTLAFIPTPIKVGDFIALLNSEGAWEMDIIINEDGVLTVQDG